MDHETHKSASCERAEDLIAVLYGEATEHEKRDFEHHLKQCGSCRAEFNAFTQVRESIGEWRDEALTGFVASPHVVPVRKSALAALRQFFDLSPLWLKGAVGFAAIVFCVLAAMAVVRWQSPSDTPQIAVQNSEAVYSKQDVDRMVREALAKQQALAQQEIRAREESMARQVNSVRQEREQRSVEPKSIVVQSPGSKNSSVATSGRVPKAQRPFSKTEREQLAAELRLISGDEADFDFPDK